MIHRYKSREDLDKILSVSQDKPVMLFKHSTACPVSSRAWRVFNEFANDNDQFEYWHVYVIEDRPLSMDIQKRTGIRHQSPQVIFFHDGQAIWDDSHFAINHNNLNESLAEYIA